MVKKEKKHTFLLIVLFAIGLILHWSCNTRKYALFLTTPFLLTISIFVLYSFIDNQKNKRQAIIFLVFVFVFTFIVEVAGVKTGLIFGDYNYGRTLWLQIGKVPVVIGINWVLLVLGSGIVARSFCNRIGIKSSIVINVIAGFFLVFVDYFIEPIAMKLDYWNWQNSFVPLRNYIAWFLISQVVFYSYSYFKIELRSRLVQHIYWILLIYFILLKFILTPCV